MILRVYVENNFSWLQNLILDAPNIYNFDSVKFAGLSRYPVKKGCELATLVRADLTEADI